MLRTDFEIIVALGAHRVTRVRRNPPLDRRGDEITRTTRMDRRPGLRLPHHSESRAEHRPPARPLDAVEPHPAVDDKSRRRSPLVLHEDTCRGALRHPALALLADYRPRPKHMADAKLVHRLDLSPDARAMRQDRHWLAQPAGRSAPEQRRLNRRRSAHQQIARHRIMTRLPPCRQPDKTCSLRHRHLEPLGRTPDGQRNSRCAVNDVVEVPEPLDLPSGVVPRLRPRVRRGKPNPARQVTRR